MKSPRFVLTRSTKVRLILLPFLYIQYEYPVSKVHKYGCTDDVDES